MSIELTHPVAGEAIATDRRFGLPPHRSFRGVRAAQFAGDPGTARQTIHRGPIGAWWVK
jgi:hypothetical protein